MCIQNGYKVKPNIRFGYITERSKKMNILKVILYLYAAASIVFAIWFCASYIDAVLNPLRQSWNFFDYVLSLKGVN